MEKETKTKKLVSATFDGFEAKVVEVESSFTRGLPGFSIVGLAGSSIQESKERVKSALLNNDYEFPPLKITINLAPSDLQKSGSHFDLPIALSILLQKKSIDLNKYLILGELGLDGSIKDTSMIFPLVLALSHRYKHVITSKESAKKISTIPGISVYAFSSIHEFDTFELIPYESMQLTYDYVSVKGKKYYYKKGFEEDFEDVKGQATAKRVALIAATGMHNLLFEGSPGVGKSMILSRLRYILPPLSLEEILEVEKMRSLNGDEPSFEPLRPFRSPHHSSTKAAIFGGGSRQAKVGEVALSHLGILFFDELPHFAKDVLENLRMPLQDNRVLISRVNSKIEYKTDFLFASAMNPCPCGNLLSEKNCHCSELDIKRYMGRISQPLLERIDLYYQMRENSHTDTVSSSCLFDQVLEAFEIQLHRQEGLNRNIKESFDFKLSEDVYHILQKAIQNFNLSKRAEFIILKVSRTIADLEKKERIEKRDMLEALNYRKR